MPERRHARLWTDDWFQPCNPGLRHMAAGVRATKSGCVPLNGGRSSPNNACQAPAAVKIGVTLLFSGSLLSRRRRLIPISHRHLPWRRASTSSGDHARAQTQTIELQSLISAIGPASGSAQLSRLMAFIRLLRISDSFPPACSLCPRGCSVIGGRILVLRAR